MWKERNKINKKFVIVLFSFVLLTVNSGLANAAETINAGGINNLGDQEPPLWEIMQDMTGDGSIDQTWVNSNQSGQEVWYGDYATVTMMATYAGSYQDLYWKTDSSTTHILNADEDDTYNVNVTFNPNDESWWFMDRATYVNENDSLYIRYIHKDNMGYNMVAFTFDDYYIVAFEDLPTSSSDREGDYQDLVIKFSVVPEPVSSTLFILGGAVFGFRRFLKKIRIT